MATPGRRRFLRIIGTATLAGAAGLALVRASGYEFPAEVRARLRVLSPWQWVVLSAVGDRLLDPERADVADFADEYLVDLAPQDRADLIKLIAVVEHVAPLQLGLLRRFSSLGPEDQDRVLVELEQSPLGLVRGGFQALKAIAMMALYRSPASWGAIGYDGPVVKWDAS